MFRESLIFQSNADALMLSRVRGMKFSILNNSFLPIGLPYSLDLHLTLEHLSPYRDCYAGG